MITPRDHPPLNSGALFVFGPCEWCGEAFMALASHFDGRSRTCSKRCARGRQRAKYDSRFRVSPKRRQQIYERDRWTCQLCKEPVDRDAHYLDDWAPTLDHIIPQSHVLVPDHSDANLRTAHRWCNSVRGDERFHSVEDLAS